MSTGQPSADPFAAVRSLLAAASERSLDEAAMRALGEAVGAALPPRSIVTLAGPLGAGKTTFVQSLARGLGVREAVTSPTYALVHEYEGARGLVVHADLYRLERADALDALGWDELLATADAALIEWPEVATSRLRADRVTIVLSMAQGDPTRRQLAYSLHHHAGVHT